jgi:hypothetical protein
MKNEQNHGVHLVNRDRVEDRQERLHDQGSDRLEEDRISPNTAVRPQGITSHSREEEDRRQSKVVPIRDEAKAGARTGRKRKPA